MTGFLSHETTSLGVLLIVALSAVSAATDLHNRKIYNALTFPAIALGLIVNTLSFGPSGALFGVSGLLVGGMLFVMPVVFLGRGAGDLKLLAAIGAIGGPAFALWCGLWAGAAGGLLAIAVLIARRNFGVVLAGIALDTQTGQFPVARSNIRLPYAVPIAAGAILVLIFA